MTGEGCGITRRDDGESDGIYRRDDREGCGIIRKDARGRIVELLAIC